MPAVPSFIIDPIWEQVCGLLPRRRVAHPLGCHRQRVDDRVVFDKLVQVLVFGCGYQRIADASCSATTLRRRRDEWIEAGVLSPTAHRARGRPDTGPAAAGIDGGAVSRCSRLLTLWHLTGATKAVRVGRRPCRITIAGPGRCQAGRSACSPPLRWNVTVQSPAGSSAARLRPKSPAVRAAKAERRGDCFLPVMRGAA